MTDISRQLQDAIARNDEALDYDGTTGAAHIGMKAFRRLITAPGNVPQTVALYASKEDIPGGIAPADILLHAHETCLKDMKAQAENFRHIEEESNKLHAARIIQPTAGEYVVVNAPYPP